MPVVGGRGRVSAHGRHRGTPGVVKAGWGRMGPLLHPQMPHRLPGWERARGVDSGAQKGSKPPKSEEVPREGRSALKWENRGHVSTKSLPAPAVPGSGLQAPSDTWASGPALSPLSPPASSAPATPHSHSPF